MGKILDDCLGIDGFCHGKPLIIGIPADDAKVIEPEFLTVRDVKIFFLELSHVKLVATCVCM